MWVVIAIGVGMLQSAQADAPRPFIYGCGVTWGNWLGLQGEEAKALDRLSMDRIKEMGGTNVGANFAWIDIEPREGELRWDYVDHQVTEARKRGLEMFAYTGLTPDWALPPEAPDAPGIGYRFPPDEKYIPQFEAFFTALAKRYRGRVKYYQFWNEPNGCSWINDGCANGHMAHTYVPWLKRWYTAMKAGDPDCVLAIGGLDYHSGVKKGYQYLEDIYKAGGRWFFDAVAIHPYGEPLHWKAIEDTYATLIRHGDAHKKLWLNEYGWNTKDEEAKAANLRTVLLALAKPEHHMVFQANYLVLTDLPEANDETGHDFGLCARDRRACTITPRRSYEVFGEVAKSRTAPDRIVRPTKANGDGERRLTPGPSPSQTTLWRGEKGDGADATSRVPTGGEGDGADGEGGVGRGTIPEGFMLTFTAPGVDPGEAGDDQGPARAIRRKFIDQAGCNVGEFTIAWRDTEREDPGEGPSRYEFSKAKPSRRDREKEFIIAKLHFSHVGWASGFRFSDRERYNKLLARWAEAACRHARQECGAGLFAVEGNERDLVHPSTYKPHFADWHFYYMDPIKAIHAGMKAAHPDNKLIIGNLCYSDRDHIGALYCAGAKGNFEVLAIHAYGPAGVHVDMEQIIESHEEMVYRGDPDIPIILTEGWSSFPLPDSIDKDPQFRIAPRQYTPQEIEHYRQTVLDGWRNLTTARPGMYDPKWVCGVRYFVLNDHWGGRGWAKRAKAEYHDDGKLKGFKLDGYWIGTSDPDYIKPFMRPWGLIDIEGKPKGDIIHDFPPYIPRHRFEARLAEELPTVRYDPRRPELLTKEVTVGKVYHVTAEFANLEDSPMTQLHFSLSEKNGADRPGGYAFAFVDGVLHVNFNAEAERMVRAKLISPAPPRELAPGATIRLEYEVVFSAAAARTRDDGKRERVRPYVDAYYVWEGRVYHTDAWMARTAVQRQLDGS